MKGIINIGLGLSLATSMWLTSLSCNRDEKPGKKVVEVVPYAHWKFDRIYQSRTLTREKVLFSEYFCGGGIFTPPNCHGHDGLVYGAELSAGVDSSDKSLDFDGRDYVKVNTLEGGNQGLQIEGLIYLRSPIGYDRETIYIRRSHGFDHRVDIISDFNGDRTLQIQFPNIPPVRSRHLPLERWISFRSYYDGENHDLYINDFLDKSVKCDGKPIEWRQADTFIGCDYNEPGTSDNIGFYRFFNGKISDLKISGVNVSEVKEE